MIRRTFMKALMASPLGFLLKPKRTSAEICNEALERLGKSGHFWMQTYGPHYDPCDIDPKWESVASALIGVYHGQVLQQNKASDHDVGTTMIMGDGRRFLCYELNERTYRKGMGIFLKK